MLRGAAIVRSSAVGQLSLIPCGGEVATRESSQRATGTDGSAPVRTRGADVVLLVRHAHAGSKRRWSGDDADRPLSRRGWEQAHGLARRLSAVAFGPVLTSPYLRCRQTVAPVCAALDVHAEDSSALTPDAPLDGVLELLRKATDRTLLCTHGEVLNRLFEAWQDDGLLGPLTPATTEKGGSWLMQLSPGGGWTARYLPPAHPSSSVTDLRDTLPEMLAPRYDAPPSQRAWYG